MATYVNLNVSTTDEPGKAGATKVIVDCKTADGEASSFDLTPLGNDILVPFLRLLLQVASMPGVVKLDKPVVMN